MVLFIPKIKIMKTIDELLNALKTQNEKYGDLLQTAASQDQCLQLSKRVKDEFNLSISEVYIYLLQYTNGFDNDGVVLYSTEKSLINGYDDRYIDGILEANKSWHRNTEMKDFLFYAESEQYLFVQSLENSSLSYRPRDDFDTIIYKAKNDKEFFEIIIKLALGENIEEEYSD